MINWQKIFEILPEITGLPWKRKGNRYYAACYIDGTPSKRWDKLTASMLGTKNGICIHEQGGSSESLLEWIRMRHCGGDYKKAFQILDRDLSFIHVPPPRPELPSRFVNQNEVKRSDLRHCNLFNYLCTVWDDKRVRQAYELYSVTPVYTRSGWATCFWYRDHEGNYLHDKIIKYGNNGKRDRSFTGFRKYKTDDGYRHRGLFGSHLLKDYKGKVRVVESEKTALIFYLEYGDVCLASGGVHNLKEIEPDWVLLRDMDSAGETWKTKWPFQCPDWFDYFHGVEEGDDIGDAILKKYL